MVGANGRRGCRWQWQALDPKVAGRDGDETARADWHAHLEADRRRSRGNGSAVWLEGQRAGGLAPA